MLKLPAIGLSAVLLFAASVPAFATPRWVEVAKGEQGITASVDASSIQGRGRYRYYWSLMEYQTPKRLYPDSPLVYGLMSYNSVDCVARVSRTRSVYSIGAGDRTILQSHSGDRGRLSVVNPITVQGAVVRFVCK